MGRDVRRKLYRGLSRWNDAAALLSGSPRRIAKRAANRWIGRNVVRRLWLR